MRGSLDERCELFSEFPFKKRLIEVLSDHLAFNGYLVLVPRTASGRPHDVTNPSARSALDVFINRLIVSWLTFLSSQMRH